MKERIEKEFKEALKEKNEIKVSVLRMLKADLHNLSKDKKELKDEDYIKVIQKHVRQHKDSIEQFEKGNRGALVEKERAELSVLETFLPKMLSEEELTKIIKDTIAELDASTKKDMGRVIKEVIAKAKGTADGRQVSRIASGLLK